MNTRTPQRKLLTTKSLIALLTRSTRRPSIMWNGIPLQLKERGPFNQCLGNDRIVARWRAFRVGRGEIDIVAPGLAPSTYMSLWFTGGLPENEAVAA